MAGKDTGIRKRPGRPDALMEETMSSFRVNTNVTAMNALRNLGNVNSDFGGSITRLSTGLRINSAADDPAGLIASENFRAQISGLDQAIRNSQDAINYARTAEGALDEISRLLREGRQLAVQSANTATLSGSQLQANQYQWDLMVESINRISAQTAFGNKRLLDGSAGVRSALVDAVNFKGINIGGTFNGRSVTEDANVSISVTQVAQRAEITGTNAVTAADLATYLATGVGAANAGSFAINGFGFQVQPTDTWGDVIARINQQSSRTGVTAVADSSGGDFFIRLQSTGYGANQKIDLADSGGVILNAAGTASSTGQDAIAEVTVGALGAVEFRGGRMGLDGLTLTDTNGNRIDLTEQGNTVAAFANAGRVTVGTAQFQIGGNAGQTALLSLGDFSANAMNIGNLDMTSATGASNAIEMIDRVIDELSRRRGEIGSFMRNILESNVRSLGIARENVSATESAIRDTDIAEEMTNFTKLQILQQSGMNVLAQANQAPQAVLSLLRG